MLALFTDAGQYENYNSNHVRQHLDNFSLRGSDIGNNKCHDEASTKYKCTENCNIGLPKYEYYKSYCQPSECLNCSGIFPAALYVIHNVVKTTNTGDGASGNYSHILIQNHVDTCRIGGIIYISRFQPLFCYINKKSLLLRNNIISLY